MATQARGSDTSQNRFLRPLVPILIVLVLGIVSLYIGSFIASAQSPDAAPLDTQKMIPYLLIGAVVVYGLSLVATKQELWTVGTREVVYMAIGAALYGVLSWATNIIQLPSVSLVSLRPAIVIPIFFGIVFGPAVGFFVGFVGNVLGDALTGWGVFPIWDIGNGLIGLVAGLMVVFRNRSQALKILTVIVVLITLALTALLLAFPNTQNKLGDGTVGGFWWVPLATAVLTVLLTVGAWFFLRGREDMVFPTLWGALAIIIGIGFTAIADIWWNGYNLPTAILGEFVPAAIPDIINTLILLPILLIAWNTARAQTGR